MRGWIYRTALTPAAVVFAIAANEAHAQAMTVSFASADKGASARPSAHPNGGPSRGNEERIDGLSREGGGDGGYDTSSLISTSELAAADVAAERARHAHSSPLGHRAPMAYAANLSASEDACMGSRSFGLQTPSVGFSFATTWKDGACRRLKNARELEALGYPEAATELLCMDREVREAMVRAHTPCGQIAHVRRASPASAPRATVEPVDGAVVLARYTVLFDFDSARLKHGSAIILGPLLRMLQNEPSLHVEIEGHTDWVGSDAYNLRLSRRRAEAVVDWLVANGIERERLKAVGRGERAPIASNLTPEGRAQNRRVEIHRQN
jgi:outer membrane protein OmpA-like peptidoglycan-associated protein